MIGWRARLAAYTAVALLAWGAIAVVRPIPEKRAGDVINGSRTPTWRERVDSLARGETLGGLLSRGGLTPEEATEALGAATTIDPRRLPAGMRVTLGGHEGSTPTKIVFQLAIDRLLHLTRTDSGWVGREERLPWTTDTIVVRGEIARTLYDAFDAGASALPSGARSELAWNVADIYEYRLDMIATLRLDSAIASCAFCSICITALAAASGGKGKPREANCATTSSCARNFSAVILAWSSPQICVCTATGIPALGLARAAVSHDSAAVYAACSFGK